ncbi:hypothetical protein MKW92_028505 [Papaver armeniacum]|nr:hypothetical protein MKW92_028505 [Papaver armeniacum]
MFLQGFFIFQLIIVCWILLPSVVVAFGETRPGCQAKCGNIHVPYPFGITARGEVDDLVGAGGCSIHGVGYGYDINCNTSYDPPKPFMRIGNREILGISETEIRIKEVPSTLCYNMSGDVVVNKSISWDLSATPFTFSDTKNKFFLVGCNSAGYFLGSDQFQKNFTSPCVTLCNSREEVKEGYCNVNGCCQSSIPKGIKRSTTEVARASNTTFLSFNPCSYAFLADYEQFTFSASDLLSNSRVREKIPVVLDWAIGNKTCEEAQQNVSTYACKENSQCSNSKNNPGYRCTCFDGYKGNAYLSPGCLGSSGDGRKDGKGCTTNGKRDRFPILGGTLGTISC